MLNMLLIMVVISKPLNKEKVMIKQKYLWKTLLATTLLTTGAANANDYFGACDPCEMDSCFGGFEIGVDFLYWKTCKDDLTYAVYSVNTPAITEPVVAGPSITGSSANLSLDWKPGFRIYTSIDDVLGNWNLYGSYTWFSTSHSSRINAPTPAENDPSIYLIESVLTFADLDFNINTYGNLETIKAKYDLSFQSFDVLFSGDYALKQCHYFKPYFGATGIFLNQEIKIESEITTPSLIASEGKWNDNYDGYGLKIGSEYNLALCDGFSIFGNGAALITVGNHSASFEQDITSELSSFSEPPVKFHHEENIFVPGYQISAGLQFDGCLCDFEYAIRIAYEFQNYFNAPNAPQFISEEVLFLSSSTTISNLGFHGLTAGVKVKF